MTKGHSANVDTVENEGSRGFHIKTMQFPLLPTTHGPTRGGLPAREASTRFDLI